MATLLRVFCNITRRLLAHIWWVLLLAAGFKFLVLDPWEVKLELLNQEIHKLKQTLEQKDHDIGKRIENNIQAFVDAALEKERANTQHVVETIVSTSLAQHVSDTVVSSKPEPLLSPATDWDKVWPIIDQRFQKSQAWADLLPPGDMPDAIKRTTAAPTPEALIDLCKQLSHILDGEEAEASSSWFSKMVKVRRLGDAISLSSELVELLQKKLWKEVLAKIEASSVHADEKVKMLVEQIRDRLRYEQAFSQLIAWKNK